jgi:hypothetical protein
MFVEVRWRTSDGSDDVVVEPELDGEDRAGIA